MSTALDAAPSRPAGAASTSAHPILEHEVRLDGRVVATICAFPGSTGFTVEAEVYPTGSDGVDPVVRHYAFSTLEQAHRFADEALVAFEYVNCTIA